MQRPSEQELEIYHRHTIECRPDEEVAAQMGCSRSQVAVICRKVETWQLHALIRGDTVPSPVASLEKSVQELDALLCNALRACEEAKAAQDYQVTETIHADGRKEIRTTVTHNSDDVLHYLDLAVSVAEKRCRVAELLADARVRAKKRRGG